MLVAGRYLPQRSLIGPALFPAYRYVLRLVILWILVSIFILVVGPATILSSRNPSLALIETAWTLTMAAVFAFGVITLVFAILERYPHEATLEFIPRRLPRVPPSTASAAATPAARAAPAAAADLTLSGSDSSTSRSCSRHDRVCTMCRSHIR